MCRGVVLSSRTHVVHPMLTRADTGGGALGIAQRVDPKSSPHQEETVFSLFPFFLPPPPPPPAIFLFLCVCFFGSGVSVRGWAPTKLTVLVIPSTCQGRCCSAHPQPSAACPARLHSTRDTLDLAPGCPWGGGGTHVTRGCVCAHRTPAALSRQRGGWTGPFLRIALSPGSAGGSARPKALLGA